MISLQKYRVGHKDHEEMIRDWKKDPVFMEEYDALEDEFSVFDELLKARQTAGLTQAQVAEKMGTKAPAIARLESCGRRGKPSPSLDTLRRYAEAIGFRLKIRLVPR